MPFTKFIWLGQRDRTTTHLDLQTGVVYNRSSVPEKFIAKWLDENLILPVIDNTPAPPDTVLDVQDGIISADDLFHHIDLGLGLKEN